MSRLRYNDMKLQRDFVHIGITTGNRPPEESLNTVARIERSRIDYHQQAAEPTENRARSML
jgi:hypothetical protein